MPQLGNFVRGGGVMTGRPRRGGQHCRAAHRASAGATPAARRCDCRTRRNCRGADRHDRPRPNLGADGREGNAAE
jgi:hypothetical protein